jgi:crotonobetainyl-CoA:carnitine CoA-transferase CaiB-like acyl-CoA transferase
MGEHTSERVGPIRQQGQVTSKPRTQSLPFEGLRVLDLGHGGVGVETARLLGEYGAEVIKVETHTYPDFIRLVSGGLMSASFASSNRGKRSLGLNAKKEGGRDVLHRLVRWADVLVENASTGTAQKMGVDYATVHQLNPRLVMVSSQLMGSAGPWNHWTGYGPTARAAGGMSHLWNFSSDAPPPGSSSIHPDHFVGRLGAVAALACLLGRETEGDDGAHVEVAQVEAIVNLLADSLLQEALVPGSVGPEGNGTERGAPWGVYRCSGQERWCVITVRDDDDWLRLRAALGSPTWAAAARFDTSAGRQAASEELNSRIATWTADKSDHEVMVTLQAARVPAGTMCYPSDLATDEHLVARRFPRAMRQSDLGDLVVEGPAFTASMIADPVVSPAPRLAEHTLDICRGVLGMADEEINRLIADGSLELDSLESPVGASNA